MNVAYDRGYIASKEQRDYKGPAGHGLYTLEDNPFSKIHQPEEHGEWVRGWNAAMIEVVVPGRVQRKADEPFKPHPHYEGFPTLRELEVAYPDGEGGLRLTAEEETVHGKNVIVTYFNGNFDAPWMANFIKRYAYVNMWTITIQPVNYI